MAKTLSWIAFDCVLCMRHTGAGSQPVDPPKLKRHLYVGLAGLYLGGVFLEQVK